MKNYIMISNLISHDFIELELDMKVAEAQAKLGTGYGVVSDVDGRPVTIITIDDLMKFAGTQLLVDVAGQLPPGIIVAITEKMGAFVHSPVFTAFKIGARGAIVYDGKQVDGILTDESIKRYLRNEFEPAAKVKGVPTDTTLPGPITDKPLIMYCDEFNHRNELAYYNRRKPPKCQVEEPYHHLIRKNK